MVLALRGSHSMADAVTDLMDRPVDISDWLPDGFRQVHCGCSWNGHGSLAGRLQ